MLGYSRNNRHHTHLYQQLQYNYFPVLQTYYSYIPIRRRRHHIRYQIHKKHFHHHHHHHQSQQLKQM